MADLTFVQGDTAPDISAVLHDIDDINDPIDLTDASVRFQMRKPDDRKYTVDAEADIVDAVAGTVTYQWADNDLAVPGDYDAQWQVTFVDQRVQTQAVPNRITVRRQ